MNIYLHNCVICVETVPPFMPEVNESVVDEMTSRSQNLLLGEVLMLIERKHTHEEPGIARDTIDAYAQVFGEDVAFEFDGDEFRTAIDDRVTDTETWASNDVFYDVADDRVSVYPQHWHDALGGSDDIPAYLRFLQNEVSGVEDDFTSGASGSGVPEDVLLDIVSVVGRTDRETVKARIQTLREEGVLAEDADQHPEARVQLRDYDENRRDGMLES